MGTARAKLIPTLEVAALITAAGLLFRGVASSPLRAWEAGVLGGDGFFALEYLAVLLLVIGVQLACRRSLGNIGLSFDQPRLLGRATLLGLPLFLILGWTLSLVDWRSWPGALIASAVSLAVLLILGVAMRGGGAPGVPLSLFIGTAALAIVMRPVASILVRTLYVYLLVGPAEELLFRGYVIGSLDEAWGRPYSFFGVRWGFGVIAASVAFGLWHVALMPLAPGVWLQALWTTMAGLSLGYLRERTGSIVPSSLLHSVMNYMPLSELFFG